MLDQLQMFEEKTSQPLTSSPLEVLAKTLALLESDKEWQASDQALSLKQLGLSKKKDLEFLSGKMLKELSVQTLAKTLRQSSKSLPTLGAIDSNGNCLIHRGFYPKTESGYTLSDILQRSEEIGPEFFLSEDQTKRIVEHPRSKITQP